MNRAVRMLAAGASVLVVGLAYGAPASADAVRDAVESANKAFVAAFLRGDSEAIGKLYAEDAKVFPPGAPMVSGRPAIAAFWTGVIAGGFQDLTLKTADVKAAGDLAVETGTVTLVPKTGAAATDKYVVVWKREGGRWRLYRDIWNDSGPAK